MSASRFSVIMLYCGLGSSILAYWKFETYKVYIDRTCTMDKQVELTILLNPKMFFFLSIKALVVDCWYYSNTTSVCMYA